MFQKTLLSIILLFSTQLSYADELGAYFTIDSFSHSEPTSINSIISTWDEKFYGGENAFSVNRAEAGVSWKQWRFGIMQRYDNFYSFSEDTAYLIRQNAQKVELVPGKQLDIYLKANSLVATGLSLGFKQTFSRFALGMTVSYLKADRFADGMYKGAAQVTGEKNYDLDFDVDYYYSSDSLFDRDVITPEGKGYSVDINIDWRLTDNWNINVNVDDLIAKINWKNAPRTLATGNTDTKEFNEDGYVEYNPVISGLETYEGYTQTLPKKMDLVSTYWWGKQSALIEMQDFEIKQFYSIGVGFDLGKAEQLKLYYNYTAEALKVSYDNNWLRFSITSDKILIYEARTFALNFSAQLMF